MATEASSFAAIQDEFNAYIGDIVYATMTTVDQKGRPRARVLISIWDLYRETSPPGAGYDLGRFWREGTTDPQLHVLALRPWRVQVVRGTDLRSKIWRADRSPG
ncbi:hypothetical protein [Acrocarpospora sp. B8E8]|uniref:hypothetical protein n=1 Tax=Acrocarpospora sp. B8E8 TaxID=3153572 RepID=UPI00325D8D31